MKSVKNNTQVLINCRNNKKLLGRVKAFDKHCNMVLGNVKKMWTQERQGQEEVQASQQGPLHLKNVPARGLSHCGPVEPAHCRQPANMQLDIIPDTF
ncbi:hypothetical protein EI555_002562 [Monodon monoceros]|uniref:Small nuclear ribonucleoprotein Sm D2 n=1 Tax=Monodon monoceros TaxID=40151 RepID=A0A4V5PA34_MONMO|nr:hypothetical protein EI555_002562 [Monodon monoceros]